jgi:hypothetical protein
MIRFGTGNIIDNMSIDATSVYPATPTANIKVPNVLKRWEAVQLSATLNFTFTLQQIDHIALYNVNFDSVGVVGKSSGATVFSRSYTALDLDGTDVKNLYVNASGEIDEIELNITNNTSPPYLGYIWAGGEVTFDFTAMQAFDNNNDLVETTRGNITERNQSYTAREYNLTLSLESYADFRSKMRQLDTSLPRSVVIECEGLPTEVLFARFDSGRIGYDIVYADGEQKGQATIGLLESWGGRSR